MKRKKLIICISIALILLSALALCKPLYANKPIHFNKQEENKWANSEDRAQGNHVLVCKGNGAESFPFVFGENLYIYNIEKNTWKLVKRNKVPLLTFGHKMTMQGSNVYYSKDFKGPGIEVYSKDVNKSGKEAEVVDKADMYAVSSDAMYYLEKEESGVLKDGIYENNVYKKDLKTGKVSKFLKGEISYLRADNDYLYCFDDNGKIIIEISPETGQKKLYKGFKRPDWIGVIDEDNIIWADCETIIKYNKSSNKKTVLKEASEKNIEKNAVYREGYMYYYTDDMTFYKLDVNSKTSTRLMSLSEVEGLNRYIKKGDVYGEVSYCTDYITVELLYSMWNSSDDTQYRRLLVYDYDGRLVRNMKLKLN